MPLTEKRVTLPYLNTTSLCQSHTTVPAMGLHSCLSSPSVLSGTKSVNQELIRTHSYLKRANSDITIRSKTEFHALPPQAMKPCVCGRRHFMEGATLGTALSPIRPSSVSSLPSDSKSVLNKIRAPRPGWYEELVAYVYSKAMKSYEAEVASYKSKIFTNMKGKARKVLELGIGTGPNLNYYATDPDIEVVGVDPNSKMEKYARAAAASAGMSPSKFEFIQAVGEAIPLDDASVDAVVATLVLCSVSDVAKTLEEVKRVLRPGGIYAFVEHVAAKEGTFLRFVQYVLGPLQRTLGDGCHLARDTGDCISKAGFSNVEFSTASLSAAKFVNPHIYGFAYK